MSSLSTKTVRFISAISIDLAPLSSSQATRSMRLLLSTLPTKPPAGATAFPAVSLRTLSDEKAQKVSVTYSNKQKADVNPEGLSLRDLIRKVRLASLLRPQMDRLD